MTNFSLLIILLAFATHVIGSDLSQSLPTNSVSAQINTNAADERSFVKATPMFEWKYGWRDGDKANLVGRARNNDALPKASSELTSGYTPKEIAAAYRWNLLPTSCTGAGETIAIIDAYGSPNLQADLNKFCQQFKLPLTELSIVYPSGEPTNQNSGWAGETTLDVEWAHAMAPGASILVVISPDDSSLDGTVSYASSNASVISMSWGGAERSGETDDDKKFNVPGVTFVAAAGDDPATVSWPAASSYVLGVGGTTLQINPKTGGITETAWKNTGGGISQFERLPTYQFGLGLYSTRISPDVSYDANPYTGYAVYFTDPLSDKPGGWMVFGGTSAASPQWAALLACREELGNSGSTQFNRVLYANAATINYPYILNDITVGGNGNEAGPGYDLVTGLGSPIVDHVVLLPNTLPSSSPTPFPTPVPTPTPTPTPSKNQTIRFRIIGSKSYKSPPFTLEANSRSGELVAFTSSNTNVATISSNTVTVVGAGTTTITANAPSDANYKAAFASQVLTVAKASQTINGFVPFSPVSVGAPAIILPATSSAAQSVTYTSSNKKVATVSGNTLTILGSGLTTITATVSASANFKSVTIHQVLKVSLIN